MDDTAFEFDPSDVTAASARFPSRHRRVAPAPHVPDVAPVVRERGSEFARHAWDESGHL